MSWFFFFKQKTAYEMRISDWSSDVCSSDLEAISKRPRSSRTCVPTCACSTQTAAACWPSRATWTKCARASVHGREMRSPPALRKDWRRAGRRNFRLNRSRNPYPAPAACRRTRRSTIRSEEHTSELQSLMRISYAVFCLKKKNTRPQQQVNRYTHHKLQSK